MKNSNECQVHGAPTRTANKMLLFMVLASLGLIVWHVAVYGPSGQSHPAAAPGSLLKLVAVEMGDLLFNRHGILAELWDVFPYFIIGILLAGYIRTYKIAVKMQAKLRRYGVLSVFLASLVGILTPLCACGTLTTAISLLFAGLPLAPVMALLVTSPLMSPSTYLITLNDLGPEWTVIRTLAAFLMGVFAGVVTHLLKEKGFKTENVFIEGAIPRGDFHDEAYPDERLRCGCKEKFGNRVAARTQNKFYVFLAKSSEMLWLVGKYVLVGVAIGTIVERYMPYEWIYKIFGRRDPFNIVWITLGSVPIFLHQISASSILYHIKSSLHGTLDNGAALAFMIGGPVTAVPTMVLFWTVFKKRVFFLYLFVCIAGTILIAYAFQFLVFVPYVDAGNPLLKDVRSLSGGSSAVITKQDKNVRIVMDPDGKSIIATYTNETEGRGGIVFDAGSARFQEGTFDRYDNKQYVRNIADWLEQNNSSIVKGRVLIIAPRTPAGIGDVSRNMIDALKQKGYDVSLRNERTTTIISDKALGSYSQVWFVPGTTGGTTTMTDNELNALSRFSVNGGSMLVVAGAGDVGMVNKIAERYGVHFSGLVVNREELAASIASNLFDRLSGAIGGLLKFTHKA